ncbi:MAG: flagellar hook protein FlgE [Acetivibrio sp.]
MMRSLYSGVSGLKVHQTKMDVIGNNIANVNTVGFKGSSVTFSDVFYQTSQSASGANAETGTAGKNAIQIGLGSNLSAVSMNISVAGGSQRTDNPFDCMISGDGFFIVNTGASNYFTKNGAFTVDGGGTLCTYDGANVMGWQVDTEGNIIKARVSPLKIMSPENQYSEPKATTDAFIAGNIDKNDPQLSSDVGFPAQVSFYDNVGSSYTAKLNVKKTDLEGKYTVSVGDIVDTNDKSIFTKYDPKTKTYVATNITKFKFAGTDYAATVNPATGEVTLTHAAADDTILDFNPSNGAYSGIYKKGATGDALKAKEITFDLSATGTDYTLAEGNPFSASGVKIDFSTITQYASSKTSKLEMTKGKLSDRTGAGLPVGNMTGVSIDQSGKIYGTYDNGTNKLLGQIAVASFSNPAGLEAVGGSLFAQTKNSGDFDGIGQDPTSGGGALDTGVLEMSNVDLSTEFTNMITTQRGFQANSRIITTSDTLLEELINLKR